MKNILIIEDSKIINNVIKRELLKFDFSLQQAFTFAEAKAYLEVEVFHLIILDLHLPDGEGSELIAHIQSLTKTKVVVLTSSQDETLREELFQYGIVDYIVKDKNLLYSIGEIVKIIHTLSVKVKEKILIIDDSKFICKQVKTILEPRNYKLISAYSAKSGLKKLHKEKFALVILDMELPDMHGIKVLEEIRNNRDYLHLPVVVLSGTATPEIVRNALKNGASDFLKKPFVFEEFILKIDMWIDYRNQEKELQKKRDELDFLNKNLQVLVAKEVEENRKKDKLMLAQSRHAQMGEMIAMIAHQWRQPLNAISATVMLMEIKAKQNLLTNDMAHTIASKIEQYVKHLSHTIDDFRDFFQPQKGKVVTDFKKIYDKALALVESTIYAKNIKISLDLQSIEKFSSYENELVQVVLNVFKNAEDIFIEKAIKNPEIKVVINNNSITISDNAGGVPKEILEKIFDPYFSTKEQKNGTGLGLYMSKIIVQEHCLGTFDVFNKEEGACFTIKIPNSKQEVTRC